uniref:Uncharacterized protein n=1 Tax=Xiphophorus couchianus TaxID=32473 RepID=A0A3B5KP30_9TELE
PDPVPDPDQDQQRVELGFSQQQRAQEAERQQVLERVRQAEDNISGRISSLLMDNSRIRMEQLTAVTQEEAGSLRRREVSLDRKFDRMLSLQVLDKSKAIAQILQEEEMQKAAFQALQLQKDAVHVYIRSQVTAHGAQRPAAAAAEAEGPAGAGAAAGSGEEAQRWLLAQH